MGHGKEHGDRRNVALTRSVIQVSEWRLAELKAHIDESIRNVQDNPDDDGAWTTVLWAAIDRQDRPAPLTPNPGNAHPATPPDKE